ncbi:MAG: hypothetical protein ABI969_03860, partial [bacterium]
MHYLSIPLGLIAFAGLLILPGTWVTFRRSGADLPFWPRLWLGVALSPTVILAQFYALRLLGVPFHATSWALLALNLPAGYWLVRERKNAGVLAADARLAVAAVAAVCVAVFGMYFAHRTVFGHAWMHADIVYRLANGQLRPEEPVMAGLRLAYPWFGHPQHAVFSDVMTSSSLANYIWPNVAYLLATLGLTWYIVRDLDGDAHATVWSLILILFAVNVVGYTLGEIAPERFLKAVPGIGGWRYSPWIRRFLSFEQEQTVIPMFSGLLYLAVNRSREAWSRYRWFIATLLLCSVGVVYTILLPAACAIVAALALVLLLPPRLPTADVVRR